MKVVSFPESEVIEEDKNYLRKARWIAGKRNYIGLQTRKPHRCENLTSPNVIKFAVLVSKVQENKLKP